MADTYQVTCVNKTDRQSAHERISHIGGRNSDGTRWRVTQQDAVDGIESGKWALFVMTSGRKVKVIVARSGYGNKYLKTDEDGEQPDNLLGLIEC